jgi:predicted RNA-binding Zn ribbon-like protein
MQPPSVFRVKRYHLTLVRGIMVFSAYCNTEFVRSQVTLNHYQNTALLAENIANTRDTTHAEPEYLRTPEDLARYLERWNIKVERAPDVRDLAEVLILRERLHSVFEVHDAAVVVKILNELVEDAQVKPHFTLTANENIKLELDVEQDMPLARRLGIKAALELSAAIEQYGIERLHVCNAEPCTEVFIDTSRNRTRRYCCEQCANRHNVALHRRRQKLE